jgi:hypothetical protein
LQDLPADIFAAVKGLSPQAGTLHQRLIKHGGSAAQSPARALEERRQEFVDSLINVFRTESNSCNGDPHSATPASLFCF